MATEREEVQIEPEDGEILKRFDAESQLINSKLETGSYSKNAGQIKESTRLKLYISGIMALVLWLGTGIVIGCHMYTVVNLSHQLAKVQAGTQSSQEEVDNIQKSITAVDSTAKSLYAFLTPFAAAVTGFFFSEITASSRDNRTS